MKRKRFPESRPPPIYPKPYYIRPNSRASPGRGGAVAAVGRCRSGRFGLPQTANTGLNVGKALADTAHHEPARTCRQLRWVRSGNRATFGSTAGVSTKNEWGSAEVLRKE